MQNLTVNLFLIYMCAKKMRFSANKRNFKRTRIYKYETMNYGM